MPNWTDHQVADATGRGKTVVVGATSIVGAAVVAELESMGQSVSRVSRGLGVALDDAPALAEAFQGATAAFIMIPFDVVAPDLRQFEEMAISSLITAIAAAELHRVVLLSGLNAHLKMGTSLGAAIMEDKIDALKLAVVVHLRAGFFMENFVNGMGFQDQAQTGTFATPFRGDLPMPLIAAADVGRYAARLLSATTLPAHRIIELHGGGHYTMEQATKILGAAVGRHLRYQHVSLSDATDGMIASGMSASFADALMETARSFNQGEVWALEPPMPGNTTPTTLETWAQSTTLTPTRSLIGDTL
ncbi:uncharacterized protein YbjT (DUF2867 family) [Devosia sp. UYZn731]|uniref:NmrA family NAD(P)-binding protein n=1 Tax=Devosia sp. UYZn731 TaxID=3156345 RepID=UPI003399F796